MLSWLRPLFVAGLLLAGAMGGAPSAFSQASGVLAQKSPDANEIIAIAQRKGYVRVIVAFENPVPASQRTPDPASLANIKGQVAAAQDAIIAAHFGSAVSPSPGQGFRRGLRRFKVSPGFAVNVSLAELQALAADSRVSSINYDRALPPSLIESVPLIGMPTAYNYGATGTGQVVAILDTGVQSSHVFFTGGKVVAEACFSVGGDPWWNPNDQQPLCPNQMPFQEGTGAADPEAGPCPIRGSDHLCAHGTHVAGIAAGFQPSPLVGQPANGVAKASNIFAIQIFTRFNTQAACGDPTSNPAPCVASYTSDQIGALDYVFEHINIGGGPVAAVNMSIGAGLFSGNCDGNLSQAYRNAIDNLRAAGVLTVAAAGNDGSTSQMSIPACYSGIVSVGSSTKSDQISDFSNISSVTTLVAPGSGHSSSGGNGILSSIVAVPHSVNTFACLQGTSMATPHVTGAIAAIRSACPNASAENIVAALVAQGTPITDTRPGGSVTKPRIRVDLALQWLGCVTGPQPAVLTTPKPGSTLACGPITFKWTSGIGVSQYWLRIGTTGPGSHDIYDQQTAAQSAMVSGLPTNGATVYVRLFSLISGNWLFNDYTYTCASNCGATDPALTTPAPGSTLACGPVSFGWTAGTGVNQYWLSVGSTGAGSNDIYNQSTGSNLSAMVSGLPTSGGTVYVRLWWLRSGATWQSADYRYTGASNCGAVLTTPAPGSTLSGTSATFQWTAGTGVSQYWLNVGTNGAGSSNIYGQSADTSTQATVSGLPANGQTVYVRLFSQISGVWQSNDYTYTACTGCGPQPAVMTSPTPSTTLSGASVTFQWTTGTSVAQYYLYVGTSGAGSSDIYSQPAATTQATVSALPNTGQQVYVRLWSKLPSGWQSNDYAYKASDAKAVMTLPAVGTTLNNTSATFQWTTGTGVSQYYLQVGTYGAGNANIYNQSTGITQATVNGLPSNGNTLYVRLWSKLASGWFYNDYVYEATGNSGAMAKLTSPTPGSQFSGTSASFSWSPGSGVTAYWLNVGTTGPGSTNVYSHSISGGSQSVSGLPANGTIYVRLWSSFSGDWWYNDYYFIASGGLGPAPPQSAGTTTSSTAMR